MVVGGVDELLHGLVYVFLRPELILIGTFLLHGVETPFHRCIFLRVSRLAHALGYTDRFTEFYKCL